MRTCVAVHPAPALSFCPVLKFQFILRCDKGTMRLKSSRGKHSFGFNRVRKTHDLIEISLNGKRHGGHVSNSCGRDIFLPEQSFFNGILSIE